MLHELLRKLLIAAAIAAPLAADMALTQAAADPLVVNGTATTSQSLKVGLNKSLVIDLPRDARDILVSNPVIADAVIRTPRRIYVTGVAVGQSNVVVFDRAGEQIVSLDLQVERDASMLSGMIARLIPDSNVNVEIVSDNIVLTGTVKNAADSKKAQDIANVFANGGAQAQPAAGGGGGSSGSSSGGGSGSSQGVQISLGSSGGSGPAPTSSVINMLSIEGEDQVQLKVTVAEVQRSLAKQLGLSLNGNISAGPISATFVSNSPFGVTNKALSSNAATGTFGNATNNLSVTLRALEQTGTVRTLAEPTLTSISGEVASFLAGGEFPVPTGRDQDGNVTITFKPFGVALGFTPVVLSEGRISLRVKTEVSELTSEGSFSVVGLTIPGLKVRRADTTLELPSGGSMVLGGMLEDSVRQSIGSFPASATCRSSGRCSGAATSSAMRLSW